MKKRILITGSTDGIGLETAKMLLTQGHHLIIHGRNSEKLEKVVNSLRELNPEPDIAHYSCDLSDLSAVSSLAKTIATNHPDLDVIINNAGVFVVPDPVTENGLDLRFVVNTIAPYHLTKLLLPILGSSGRVINLSSAAQTPVSLDALKGTQKLDNNQAYAQSKLALTMWSRHLAQANADGPTIIAVNPGSFLGSKMVKEAYGNEGKDLGIGAKILTSSALDKEFADATGKYFDNDSGTFSSPHPDALNEQKISEVVQSIEEIVSIS